MTVLNTKYAKICKIVSSNTYEAICNDADNLPLNHEILLRGLLSVLHENDYIDHSQSIEMIEGLIK